MCHKINKAAYIITIILIISIFTIGCTQSKSQTPAQANVPKQSVIEQMRANRYILNVDEKLENTTVNLVVTVNTEIATDAAVQLISNFFTDAKDDYKGKQINVQIVQNGGIIGGLSFFN